MPSERGHTRKNLRRRDTTQQESQELQLHVLPAHRESAREKGPIAPAGTARGDLAQAVASLKRDLEWVIETFKEDQPALREKAEEVLRLLEAAMKLR